MAQNSPDDLPASGPEPRLSPTLGIWEQIVAPGDLVFDVGANIGNKTAEFLARGARVVCVEPQPHCVEKLRERFAGRSDVVIVPQGVAARPGTLQLSICREKDYISTFAQGWKAGRFTGEKWDETVDVEVTTLAALVAAHGQPRFCKIDVEGFELEALNGLAEMAGFLSFEYSAEFQETARACLIRLNQLGCRRFNFSFGESQRFSHEEWLSSRQLLEYLDRQNDPLFWGDIYACADGKASAVKAVRPPEGEFWGAGERAGTAEDLLLRLAGQRVARELKSILVTGSRSDGEQQAFLKLFPRLEESLVFDPVPGLPPSPPDLLVLNTPGETCQILGRLPHGFLGQTKLIYLETGLGGPGSAASALEEIRTLLEPGFVFLGYASTPPGATGGGRALFINISQRPRVSAIVSTYNSEKFLAACLDDLEAQTIARDLEIIVVDSGSRQNERAIVEAYQRRYDNIVYVRTERETLYAAWNRGVRLAKGRYITNANSDDSHRADALQLQAEALDAHPEAGLAYGDYFTCSVPNDTFENPHITRRVAHPPFHPATLMFYCVTGCHPLWRKSVFDRIGLFDPLFSVVGDYEFLLRFAQAGGRAVRVPEHITLFYQNPEGITFASEGRSQQEWAVIQKKYRNETPIERLFKVTPWEPESVANGWTALGNLALNHPVPWFDNCAQDIDYAITCYQNALHHSPSHGAAMNNLAIARIVRGQMNDPEAFLRGLPRESLDKIVSDLRLGRMEIIPVDLPPPAEPLEYRRPGLALPAAPPSTRRAAARPEVVSTPVRWLAPFLTPGEYSRDALSLVAPLHERAAYLTTLDQSEPYSEPYHTSLPDSDQATLRETRERYNLAIGGITVSEHTTDQFTRGGSSLYCVARTTTEVGSLPLARAKICNQTDEIWVPSRFVLEAMAKGGVERSKLHVIPPAVNPVEFDPDRVLPFPLPGRAGWNFLSVFEWSERAGWDVLLSAYLREFSAQDDVCLYLLAHLPSKTVGESLDSVRRAVQQHVLSLSLGDRPPARIEILDLPDRDLPRLYRAADCLVAPTRGEGWGRQHLEAMMMRLPVIATDWGAHTDHLTAENSWLISSELTRVRAVEPELLHLRWQHWAEPSETHLRQLLRLARSNPAEASAKGRLARAAAEQVCPSDLVADRVVARLAAIERNLSAPSCPLAPVRPPSVAPEFPEVKPEELKVAWEGPFLEVGSIAHVNRELSRCLAGQPRIHVTPVGRNTLPPSLPKTPYWQESARALQSQAPSAVHATIRHSWPPNWQRPQAGAWVLIQPWEFGVLPADWVRRLPQVDEIWVPSEFVRRSFVDSGVDPFRVKVVPNGVDPARFHPDVPPLHLATRKAFKFLFVGGAVLRKGFDVLLEAYSKSFAADDDVCLVIKEFGQQGAYAAQTLAGNIKIVQARAGAPEILHLTEEIPPEQIAALYTACDALVHPYRGEGFGLPILEGMACGLPVIITGGGAADDFAADEFVYRIPAQRKQLANSISGMALVHPGWWLEPQPEALAERLRWVVSHQDEARAKGRAAGDHVRREWTWERAARIAAQRLQDLVARQKAAELAAAAPAPPTMAAGPVETPPVAAVGSLAEARNLLGQERLAEAWNAAGRAMRLRPFHPEAALLLAEIARAAGDFTLAGKCAGQAALLAPKWAAPRALLESVRNRPASKPLDEPVLPALVCGAPRAPRLTVCLITRDEERWLAQCLRSVQGVADQIVVVDTGSRDRTLEIASEFGAETHTFDWVDDFSAARNAALLHATGDWILVLDADEELTEESREVLSRELRDPSAICYRLPIFNAGREAHGCNYVPRLFRNAPGVHFTGRIHEEAFSSLETLRQRFGMTSKLGGTRLRHHGYSVAVKKSRDKTTRNLRLLDRALRETPEEPNLLMNLGLELLNAGQREEGLGAYRRAFRALSASPPGAVSPEVREAVLTQFSAHLLSARRSEEIVQTLQSPLARRDGLTASTHFTLGLALVELEQYEKAAANFSHCLAKRDQPALTPVNPDILKAAPHHCLALCLSKLERIGPAEAAFRAALEAEPRGRGPRFDFARWLSRKGRPVEALEQLHKLSAENPADAEVWHLGGHIALSSPRPDFLAFADDWTREAVRSLPQNQLILAQRAEVLRRREAAARPGSVPA